MKFELHTTENVVEASITNKWIVDGTIEELKEFYSHVTDCCPVPVCPTDAPYDHTDLMDNLDSPMLLREAVKVYKAYSELKTGNPRIEAIRFLRLKLTALGVEAAKHYVETKVMPQCV